MRLPVLLALIPALLSSPLPAAAEDAKKAPPQPKAVIESREHVFGDVAPGTPLEHAFTTRNSGSAGLRIEKVEAAGGCTTAQYDTVIAPGKSGLITLAVKNTRTYKGAVAKTATITTSDPERTTFRLVLRATFPKPPAGTGG